MSDGGGDAKVFDQSFGSEGPPIAIRLNAAPLFDAIERIEAAAEERPGVAHQIRALMARAKDGVEQIGIVRVASLEGADIMLEVTPSRDLLDALAEIEAEAAR